jgi:activator of HSP90 ATPase
MELVEGKRIVQAWHFNESGWPDDHFSVCTFLLEPNSKGTKLTFIQTDVPSQNYDSLNEGWYTYYWNPIEQYLQRK